MKKLLCLSIFTSILSLVGCKTEEEKYFKEHKVIFYQTKEFDEFELKSKIKIKEAFDIQTKFANDNKTRPEICLYFIIDGFYVFSSFTNLKTPVASTRGIWVDSKTGKSKYVKEEMLLKATNFYERQ